MIIALGTAGAGHEAHSIAVRFTASGELDSDFAR
jgi:hypothetical protein